MARTKTKLEIPLVEPLGGAIGLVPTLLNRCYWQGTRQVAYV